ncbi:ABC transporter substrate-binding protein [Salsipaludibacter albus]|uniref:ABC transporter substrate-binding protein n=1 Tax=Salsipaludibacter albus TaxID=2849650 RepID=UPI001EE4DE32|nr:ABC transporter substrate-binding protein [Salsipaludibacter albus]MBY5164359.1 ABC transporter substrate-binding protein [Salsipaludibacter albus]
MQQRTWRLATVVAATALVVTGCTAGETADDATPAPDDTGSATEAVTPTEAGTASDSDSEAPASGDASVILGFAADPLNLDFTTTDGAAIPEALLVNVYEGLVKVDQSGEIVPALATDWEVSEDGTTYTFTLAEGVTFSNGDEFTAEDAKFSIERVQSDDWTVSLKAGMDVVESVEAPSDTELVVTLAQPSNSWLYAMTTRIGAMFSTDGVDDLATTAIGTGPYEVTNFVQGDRLEFTRRDDYWGEAPAYADVTFRYFDDGNALNNALLGDDIDVVATVQAPEAMGQFEDTEDYQVIEGTSQGEVVLSLNNTNPPLDDVRVRQAIRYAIDNEAVRATAWAGYGTMIGSMVPPTDPWYEDLTEMYPLDLDQATALLEEADATDITLDFKVPNLPYAVNAAQTVQSNLAQVGITAEIETLEFPAVWLEDVFTNFDYHMSIIAHVEPRDISAFANPDYYFQYDSADVQQLLADADTGSPEEQVELTAQAARTISEDAAAEFLFLAPNLLVANQSVTGLPENRVGEAFDLTDLAPAG